MLANEISRDVVRGYDLQLQRAKPEKSSQDTKKSPSASISEGDLAGADTRIRTGDLVITNDALYRLSYISLSLRGYTASTRYIILTIADICKDFF